MDTIKKPKKITKENQAKKIGQKKEIKEKKNSKKITKNTAKNRLNFFSSIRTKATILAVLISTVPLILVGAGSIFISKESLEKELLQSEQSLAEDLQDKVNFFMQERLADIEVLSRLDIFTNLQIRDILSPQEKKNILTEYQEKYGVYDSIALFDAKGDVIAQTPGSTYTNVSNRIYIQEALKQRKAILSQPIISASSGIFSVYATAPIKDKNTQEIIGFISARSAVKNIEKIIKNYQEGGRNYYLIDKNKEIFIAPDGIYVNQRLSNQLTLETPQSPQKALDFTRIYPQLENLKQRTQIFTGESFNTKTKTTQLVVYIPPAKNLLNLDWSVIVATDIDVAFATQKQLTMLLIYGTIATIIIITIIAIYISDRATKPILKIGDQVAEIGQGNLDTRLTFNSNDEIGLLADNINLMANQLTSFVNIQRLRLEKTQLLAEIGSIQTQNEDELQYILDSSLAKVRTLLKVDRMVVYRFNPDFSGYISSESVGKGWTPAKLQEITDSCIPAHILNDYKLARVVPTEDVFKAGFHPDHLDLMKRLQIKANLVIGIAEAQELYGLLVAHHCSTTHKWSTDEINFMQDLAKELSRVYARFSGLTKIRNAQKEAENLAQEQSQSKEQLQRRALELLMEVDPVSRGDLTIRARVEPDEIGTIADSYNATIESLRKIVRQVQAAAKVVAETTEDNETFIQDLSRQIQTQVVEMNNTLTRIETMGQSIQRVAENAQEAAQAVIEASKTVATGDEAMNRTVEGILALRTTVAETAKKVKRLGESSQKISKVVNLIDNFTEQTNLLALNASIEAANAGEEGRGFAIVAEEVRNLAKQSAEATAEIAVLVEEIQTETNEVVAAMETGTEQVVTGTKLVGEARESLNQIEQVSWRINQLVQAIAQATVEQSQDSEIASQTINEIANITEKTAISVENVSISFQQLLALAQELQASVGKFKVH